jgi:hypothetical protein
MTERVLYEPAGFFPKAVAAAAFALPFRSRFPSLFRPQYTRRKSVRKSAEF